MPVLSVLAIEVMLTWIFFLFEVHDEIGRGNFLALYIASGAFGSLASLMGHSLILRNLATTSLGASGAMCSLIAAWCMLHQK